MTVKRKTFLATGLTAALLAAGCGADKSSPETEALQQQIAQLEQKVAELEQQDTASVPSEGSASTTYTMEELADMVDAFADKVRASSPNGEVSESTEQFFTLKQEEKQIDDHLDVHEDELEAQYRGGTLTRDEYKELERELERLEDRLDDAEDELEYIFGIDD